MINTILLILISIALCIGVVAFIMVMNKKSFTKSTSQPTSSDCGDLGSRVDDSHCTYGGSFGFGAKKGCPSGQICCKNTGDIELPRGFTQCVVK